MPGSVIKDYTCHTIYFGQAPYTMTMTISHTAMRQYIFIIHFLLTKNKRREKERDILLLPHCTAQPRRCCDAESYV
jgi:hypothetical protein